MDWNSQEKPSLKSRGKPAGHLGPQTAEGRAESSLVLLLPDRSSGLTTPLSEPRSPHL